MKDDNDSVSSSHTIRINECRDMEEYHTSMSLKATKDGESVKAKEHARKAQAYRQKLNKLLSSADKI